MSDLRRKLLHVRISNSPTANLFTDRPNLLHDRRFFPSGTAETLYCFLPTNKIEWFNTVVFSARQYTISAWTHPKDRSTALATKESTMESTFPECLEVRHFGPPRHHPRGSYPTTNSSLLAVWPARRTHSLSSSISNLCLWSTLLQHINEGRLCHYSTSTALSTASLPWEQLVLRPPSTNH